MLEIKITLTAPELETALNNLAAALDGKAAQVAPTPAPVLAAAMNTPANPAPAPVAAPVPAAAIAPAPAAAPVPTVAPAPVGAPVPAAPAPVGAPVPAAPAPVAPAPVAPAPVAAPVPTVAPTYTLDQLAVAGTSLIDAGKMNQLMGLLKKYGVETLTNLPPQSYGAMATDLRALGARI